MTVLDAENLGAPHSLRELGTSGGEDAASDISAMESAYAVAVLQRDPAAAARFVVDWMERETGIPFGDMIGLHSAQEILDRAGRKAGDGCASFRKITWPICGDCFRHIEPGSAEGHLSWCPYAGDTDFPRYEG